MDTPLQLIVGLGNPGKEYDRTRHNAGADFVSELSRALGATLSPETKFHGLTAKTTLDGQDLRLLIPTTFMNRSGQSIGAIAQFFKIPPEAILVAHDELDLPPGTARLKHGARRPQRAARHHQGAGQQPQLQPPASGHRSSRLGLAGCGLCAEESAHRRTARVV